MSTQPHRCPTNAKLVKLEQHVQQLEEELSRFKRKYKKQPQGKTSRETFHEIGSEANSHSVASSSRHRYATPNRKSSKYHKRPVRPTTLDTFHEIGAPSAPNSSTVAPPPGNKVPGGRKHAMAMRSPSAKMQTHSRNIHNESRRLNQELNTARATVKQIQKQFNVQSAGTKTKTESPDPPKKNPEESRPPPPTTVGDLIEAMQDIQLESRAKWHRPNPIVP